MNGKGDSPRSCFSQQYRENYDRIFKKKPALPTDEEIRRNVTIIPRIKKKERENAALLKMSDKADTITIKRPTYRTLLSENVALRKRLEILSKNEYVCVDREHGLYRSVKQAAIDAARKEQPWTTKNTI